MVKNMTNGKPIKHIVEFAVPMLIGNIFQQVYNLVDASIVGRYVGSDALAAVGAAGSTMMLLISLLMGLTNGASIIMSQYFGSERYDDMRKSVTALIYITLVLSVLITFIGLFSTDYILILLNTPQKILPDARIYLKILFSGILMMGIYNSCSAFLRSVGDSRTSLYMLIVASAVNVGLDLLFVIKFNMGVKGVGFATLIAQSVSAILSLIYILSRRSKLYIEFIPLLPQKNMLSAIIKIGVPTALQSSLLSIGGMSVQSLINSFGENTIAAYTAANKIDSMAIQPIVSVGMAMSVFTGQNIGAGKIDRIKTALRQVIVLMICMSGVLAVMIVCFRNLLLKIFLDPQSDIEAISIASEYLCIIAVAYVSASVMQSFLNVLRGAGDVNFSMTAGLTELTVRIIFAYMLVYFMKTQTGIWIATPIAWVTACILTVIRYMSGKWKTKTVIN